MSTVEVQQHKRKGRVVKKHKRSTAWVALHPRYKVWGDRPNSGMELDKLRRKRDLYQKELSKIRNGGYSWVQAGHEAFILRRLRAANSSIKKKLNG